MSSSEEAGLFRFQYSNVPTLQHSNTPSVGPMKIDVLTLFPAMFAGPLDESIIKRARESSRLDLRLHNLRDYSHDRHRTVDDRPFGGGPGLVLQAEPIYQALKALLKMGTKVLGKKV